MAVKNSCHFSEFHYPQATPKITIHQSRAQNGMLTMAIVVSTFFLFCLINKFLILLTVIKLESIVALEKFMLKHRKDYVDLHRTTEQERDSIEQEVSSYCFLSLV